MTNISELPPLKSRMKIMMNHKKYDALSINEQFFKKSKEDEYLTTGSPSVLFVSAEQMFIQMKEKSTD